MPFQGDEYLINSTTAGNQSHPTQTVLGNGDILVTWESQENTTGTFPDEVRARILNPDGTVNTPDFIVNTAAESQNAVATTTLPDGDALVTWTSTDPTTLENDVFARVVDTDGHLGAQTLVNSFVADDIDFATSSVSAATLADGNVMVVSSNVINDFADGREAVGHLLDAEGRPVGSEFTIDPSFPDNQFNPQVAAMPDGRAFVTWTVQNHGSGTMYGQFLNPDGSADAPHFQIEPPVGAFSVTPTALSNDTVLVTWDFDGVNGQILDSKGAAVGPSFQISDGAIESVTGLADGRALAVLWQSGSSGDGIYARVINADGSMSNPEFLVNSETDRSVFSPHVTELPNGEIFVSWTSTGANGDSDIHGRVLTLDGTDLGTSGNDVIHGTAGDDVIHGGDGNDVIFGEGGSDTIAGDAGHNQLWGNDGNDTFIGGVGTDSIAGGGGVDTVSYEASAAAVVVDLTEHTASGGDAAGDTLNSIENLTGSAFNDSLTGDAAANHLDGGDGNDALTGRAGDDVLHGGGGNDILWGNEGNDVLNGGAGADVLTGGAGTDTVDYGDSSAGVTVDLALGTGSGGDAQGDKLSSIENVTGSAFNDHLTGNNLANDMSGGAGNDVIDGGTANDTIHGGDGNDSIFGGDGNDTIQGDAGHNILWGNGGDDTFIAGDGTDNFAGGGGADTVNYDASHAGITVDLAANTASGGDAAGDTFNSIENITGTGFKDVLTGDASDNQLTGGDGNDVLTGGTGNDVLHGDAGNDQMWGNDGNDIFVGGAGADTLSGGFGRDTADYSASTGGVNVDLAHGTGRGGDAQGDRLSSIENVTGTASNDTLTGSNSANHLLGGDGNDRLDGGRGNDLLGGGHGVDSLKGGSGADVFYFASIQDSTPGHEDRIMDFSSAEHDQINLSNIDADTHAAGNQDFAYIGDSAFTDTAGQLRYADHFLEGDVNGDGTADFRVHVNVASLSHGDFIV